MSKYVPHSYDRFPVYTSTDLVYLISEVFYRLSHCLELTFDGTYRFDIFTKILECMNISSKILYISHTGKDVFEVWFRIFHDF